MTQDAHAFRVGAAFDFEHLLALEFHQARMGQVKRNRNAGHAVRREPLFGQPDVRLEANAAFVEFTVETFDVRLEEGVLDLDGQIANPHVEQMLVSQTVPGKLVAQAAPASLSALGEP